MNSCSVRDFKRKECFREGVNYESVIIFFYLIFSSPFLFSGILFSNFLIPYFLKFIFLIFIFSKALKYGITSRSYLLLGFCFFYTLLHAELHPNSMGQSIGDLQDIIFAIFCWNIVHKSKRKNSFKAFLLLLSFIVAFFVVLETGVFLLRPSLFTYTELVGYEVFYNRLLGIISIDNMRPCWFFAEPSYCGAFLLWNLVLFRDYTFPKRLWKFLYYIILFAAFISTASFGSFVVLGLTIVVLLMKRFLHLNNFVFLVGLFAAVLLYLTVFQNYEPNDDSLIRTHSMNARKERVEMGREMRSEMGIFDKLLGLGVNAAGFKNEIGLSDAYNKMYIENGILFLLLYLLILYKSLKKDIVFFSSVILSLMTVIVQIFPLTFLTVIIAGTVAKYKFNMASQ